MSPQYQISVDCEAEFLPWKGLVPILETLLPLKLSFCPAGAAATICLRSGHDARGTWNGPTQSSLTVPRNAISTRATPMGMNVTFADDSEVPFPFGLRSLRIKTISEVEPVKLKAGERVLANCDRGPVWTVSVERGVSYYRSAFPLPAMGETSVLQDVFSGDHFLELLPLFHFLRKCCAAGLYQPPPLRACFMVDDPNLHWPTYGYVDFRQIAAHAAKENYHVSFATIPLDNWFTHNATAQLFRNNTKYLSLLVHGNDHTRNELARDYNRAERIFLLNQAMKRIERLQKSAGVEVSPVMAAPHGACSEAMLAELPGCGFEAACISHSSLRSHNRSKTWTRDLGYLPSEWIQDCPVLPRWGFSPDLHNRILLAAYLSQPMIIRAHQEDLKNGIGLIDEVARFINELGPVSWFNMAELSRISFLWRLEGQTLRLHPMGRRLDVRLPEGARYLAIDGSSGRCAEILWLVYCNGTTLNVTGGGATISLPESHGCTTGLSGRTTGLSGFTIRIEMAGTSSIPVNGVSCRPAARAILRRLVTEGRDRFFTLS